MKHFQKGSASVIVIIVILVLIAGYILFKENPVSNSTDTQQRTSAQQSSNTSSNRNTNTSPALALMQEILVSLGAYDTVLAVTPLEWSTGQQTGGRSIRATYSGYSFVVTHSQAELNQMAKMWNETSDVDDLDIAARFADALKQKGFTNDQFNSGDATFTSASAFTSERIVCSIKYKSSENGPTSKTVICADKK